MSDPVYQLLPDTTRAIIWRGLALPMFRSRGGYFRSKDIVDLAWSSIILIIATPRRFRVMLPEFGAGIYEEVFENAELAAIQLKDALDREVQKWDTRISAVEASVNVVDPGDKISIFARFRVKGYPSTIDKQLVLARQSLLGG